MAIRTPDTQEELDRLRLIAKWLSPSTTERIEELNNVYNLYIQSGVHICDHCPSVIADFHSRFILWFTKMEKNIEKAIEENKEKEKTIFPSKEEILTELRIMLSGVKKVNRIELKDDLIYVNGAKEPTFEIATPTEGNDYTILPIE